MTIALTREFLSALCPRPQNATKARIWDGYVGALTSVDGAQLFADFQINTKPRMAHLLAQWCHECAGFTLIWESGAYSAKRIMQIFGVGHHSASVTQSEANRLAGNGYALFERVYGLGNPRKARELGNTQKGDGFNFRGCGIVQLTGRGAHERYAAKIGCPLAEIEKPINSIHGALLEWQEKGCNAAADKDDIVAVTKKVNGGRNGLAERRMYLAKAKKLLANLSDVPGLPRVPEPETPKAEVAIGDEGVGVRELQALLVRAGYVTPVDGKMGPRTEGQIAAFQVNHGLKATGVADEKTLDLLREVKPLPEREVDSTSLQLKSRIYAAFARIHSWLKWLYRTLFGTAVAEASGLDVVDSMTGAAGRVQGFVGRLELPGGLSNPKVWVLLALVAGGVILWVVAQWAKQGMDAREEDAKLGANLSV